MSDTAPKKPIYKRWWFWAVAVFLFMGLIGSLNPSEPESMDTPIVSDSGSGNTEPAKEDTCVPIDDLTTFTCRYGTPDKDESTENDTPSPLVITRILTYSNEGVKAIYVPATNEQPIKKWKLVAFQDTTTLKSLTPAEAVERMKARDKNAE